MIPLEKGKWLKCDSEGMERVSHSTEMASFHLCAKTRSSTFYSINTEAQRASDRQGFWVGSGKRTFF